MFLTTPFGVEKAHYYYIYGAVESQILYPKSGGR